MNSYKKIKCYLRQQKKQYFIIIWRNRNKRSRKKKKDGLNKIKKALLELSLRELINDPNVSGDEPSINNWNTNFLCILFSGEIRECFPTTFKLGRRNNPVKVTDNCQLQRTQNDPNSSIRACICTSDYCNDDLFDNNNQVGGNNNLLCTLFS